MCSDITQMTDEEFAAFMRPYEAELREKALHMLAQQASQVPPERRSPEMVSLLSDMSERLSSHLGKPEQQSSADDGLLSGAQESPTPEPTSRSAVCQV